MVGINDLRFELAHRAGGLLLRHRVRQIHADERHIDVFQRAHLGDVLRVAAQINEFATERDHVSVAAAFDVEF